MNSLISQTCCNEIYNFHNLKKSNYMKIRLISQPKTIRGERSTDVVYIKCQICNKLKLQTGTPSHLYEWNLKLLGGKDIEVFSIWNDKVYLEHFNVSGDSEICK